MCGWRPAVRRLVLFSAISSRLFSGACCTVFHLLFSKRIERIVTMDGCDLNELEEMVRDLDELAEDLIKTTEQ